MVSRDNNLLAERHINFRIFASTLIAFGLLASVANDWAPQPVALLDYVDPLGWLLFTGALMLGAAALRSPSSNSERSTP